MGGKVQERQRFYVGRHALVPFLRQDDIPIVADVCASFVLDNSAFTFWKRGGEIDREGYYAFCDTWHRHPCFNWAIIPDVIEGTEKDNDRLLSEWPGHIKGVPVYHMHESLDRAEKLVNEWDTVAIGSSGEWPTPGAKNWWSRMSEIMDRITDKRGRPKCKLHGLRMLNPKVFSKLPLQSADSTNAVVNASALDRFGMYKPPRLDQRADIIASRVEQHNSAPVWQRA